MSQCDSFRYSRAAVTSAAITWLSRSLSGCHCTPRKKRRWRASSATVRSSAVQLLGISGAAIRRTLMVSRRGGMQHADSGGARYQRPVRKPHIMRDVDGVAVWVGVVALVSDDIGQMLVQRAAQRDVHQLHPTADALHRHLAPPHEADELQLEDISLGDRSLGARVARLAVVRGVDVDAAYQQHAVHVVKRLVNLAGQVRVGHQDHRPSTRSDDMAKVGSRHERGLHWPGAGDHVLKRRDDADDRPIRASAFPSRWAPRGGRRTLACATHWTTSPGRR